MHKTESSRIRLRSQPCNGIRRGRTRWRNLHRPRNGSVFAKRAQVRIEGRVFDGGQFVRSFAFGHEHPGKSLDATQLACARVEFARFRGIENFKAGESWQIGWWQRLDVSRSA